MINAAAGWPEPVAVSLHCAAPVMLLAMVEAARSVLLRRIGRATGTLRDSIPRARWLLSPWRTWMLWRRMVLWQITDYLAAIEAELAVRHAVTSLRARYGRRWRRHAPADLVWMLRSGVRVQEACAAVGEIVASVDRSEPAEAGDRDSRQQESSSSTVAAGGPRDLGDRGVDVSLLAEAARLNRQHWQATGRPVSAETVRKHLKIGAARSRALTRAVRAEDRKAVSGERHRLRS